MPDERSVLIVKTGSTVPEVAARRGDFEDWIARGMGLGSAEIRVVRVYEGEALPHARDVRSVVVTGSSALVSEREPWSERSGEWLAGAVEAAVPVLAICYGHQLLAQACGGKVGRNPTGREIGTVAIQFDAPGDPLLGALSMERFQASHVESVLELPPGARRLGWNAADANHAFALGSRAWGIQFHPEFDADIARGYIRARRERIESEGLDAADLEAKVAETPAGPVLLRRFRELFDEESGRDQ